jgi:hypothetical protein
VQPLIATVTRAHVALVVISFDLEACLVEIASWRY